MFRLIVGIAAVLVGPLPVSAQEDRPCEEAAIEMLAGDWDRDDFLILGGEAHRFQSVSKGEIVAPGQVRFEQASNGYLIKSYHRSGGTVQAVDLEGEPLAPPADVVVRACGRHPDAGTYYWIEEGRTGSEGSLEYRKEFYATSEHAIEILHVKSPVQGNNSEYVAAGSAHMTRRTDGTDQDCAGVLLLCQQSDANNSPHR